MRGCDDPPKRSRWHRHHLDTRGHSWTPNEKILVRAVYRNMSKALRLDDLFAQARPLLDQRPTTRADCLPGGAKYQRPCPWVTCRYHAAIVEDEHGNVRSSDEGKSTRAGRRQTWPRKRQPDPVELERLTDLARRYSDGRERLTDLARRYSDGRQTCVLDVIESHATPAMRRKALGLK